MKKISFDKREMIPEMMDDLEMGGKQMDQTLDQLAWINFWLGGRSYLWKSLKELLPGNREKSEAIRVVDLGCGGGDELRFLCRKARRRGLSLRYTGVDANPNVVDYARRNSRAFPEINYQVMDVLSEELTEQPADIFICSLFLHHFSDEELVEILRKLAENANLGVVISDLHRHRLAYYAFGLVTRLMGASYMIRHDGLLSIRKSFHRKELRQLLEKAGFRSFRIRWRWAFRFQVVARS
jgi:2-polyprenyl-3-methyl-5-hydroxy-6-metoxy-1,4-benzoquinol methylase